ncbi:MAG TPA: carboxypeptidase-like regulatory domain-containing protein [Kofleriaceae bacterium]|jgi:hypothetical protein
MVGTRVTRVVWAAVLGLAGTAAASPGQLVGGVRDPASHAPVDGADVVVVSPSGHRTEVTTTSQGLYRAPVDEPGTYVVTFQLGTSIVTKAVELDGRSVATLDVTLEGPETIEIHEHVAPPVLPKPIKSSKRIPPYSDQLALSDHWLKQWVLLDIDERGTVARMKFLGGPPGYDLALPTARFALDMKFSPARDSHGRPTRLTVVWPIEWPSYWWLIDHGELPLALPRPYGPELSAKRPDPMRLNPEAVLTHVPMDDVPCAGSGPLDFDRGHPVYRDCSRPDLKSADQQPWIDRSMLP